LKNKIRFVFQQNRILIHKTDLQRKLKNYSSQGGWLVSKNLLQF